MISHPLSQLLWIEELLPGYAVHKRMHGGIGYYLDEKLSLILVESGHEEEHKGVSYPFAIWQGCIFPIEKIKQGRVFIEFPFLENHPASAQWLYLPLESENFEENVRLILRELFKRNPLFGLPIKTKSRQSDKVDDDESAVRPQSFREKSPTKNKIKKSVKKESKAPKKIKADKKSENAFMLSLLKRKK